MSNILEKQFLKQRNDFEKSCVERDKKYHFPQGVIFETDIAYAKDKNKAHRLDRYRPKGKEAQILPVIINVHGGGLLLGNKEFNKYFCAALSKKGFLVYSMEYRLIPDCTFFDQLRDIFLAMDFDKGTCCSRRRRSVACLSCRGQWWCLSGHLCKCNTEQQKNCKGSGHKTV